MTWTVQLAGDSADLSALQQSLTGRDVCISHDGQNYVLTSDEFNDSDNAKQIHEKATRIVELLNGAKCLALDASESIRVGNAIRYRSNGTREVHMFAEPAVIRLRFSAVTFTVTRADGTVEESNPGDPVGSWMTLAMSDDSIANVFRILSLGTLDWVNLYRVLEIVENDVGGLDLIELNGWATKNSMKLFKHTANSPGAVGLEARHGSLPNQPPANPMTVSEAKSLINSIIRAWLRTKSSNP